MLTEKAINAMRMALINAIAQAQYTAEDEGGLTATVDIPIDQKELQSDGGIVVTLTMGEERQGRRVTAVRLLDSAGDALAQQAENILHNVSAEGVLYRFRFDIGE